MGSSREETHIERTGLHSCVSRRRAIATDPNYSPYVRLTQDATLPPRCRQRSYAPTAKRYLDTLLKVVESES
jgi:hypothetical protein